MDRQSRRQSSSECRTSSGRKESEINRRRAAGYLRTTTRGTTQKKENAPRIRKSYVIEATEPSGLPQRKRRQLALVELPGQPDQGASKHPETVPEDDAEKRQDMRPQTATPETQECDGYEIKDTHIISEYLPKRHPTIAQPHRHFEYRILHRSSAIPCLQTHTAINLAAGCLHKCVYCYAGGSGTKSIQASRPSPKTSGGK